MPSNILMPALSPTMKHGDLVKWLKQEGEHVEIGDVLAEIETDKATMEVESVETGKLGKILVPAGTTAVEVHSVIAVLLAHDEDESLLDSYVVPSATLATHSTKDEKPEASSELQNKTPDALQNQTIFQPGTLNVNQDITAIAQRINASPLAKKLANDHQIELEKVKGSGPYGRVIKDDVENILSYQQKNRFTSKEYRSTGMPEHDRITLSGMRKIIAQRLCESKQTVPHFYLSIHCMIDKLLDLRKNLNEHYASKISVNDMIIRASALALQDVPNANVSWAGDHIKQYKASDVSVAVSIPDGLVTPVIRDAEKKTLVEISQEMKTLATKARDGKLKLEEFQGGTMSISNLGMFNVSEFSAIINPPQGLILAIGSGEKKPVVIEDKICIATMMTCAISVDHRVIDGVVAAQWLQSLKIYLEQPIKLII